VPDDTITISLGPRFRAAMILAIMDPVFGSHIDSVLHGGNFNGDAGSMGAISVGFG